MTDEIWHRFEDRLFSNGCDEWGESTGSHVEVRHIEYRYVRHTPKGVWVAQNRMCKPRFVLKEATKRFACPTVDEARKSFVARKKKQISIYQRRCRIAEQAIALVNGSVFGAR